MADDLDALRAATVERLHHWPSLAATTVNDCLGHLSAISPEDDDWCVYDASEDDPPWAEGFIDQAHAEVVAAVWNAWPALLARLEAAERENTDLREALAYEADVIEAQTSLSAIKGNRRRHIDEAIVRMREAAVTGFDPAQRKYRFSWSFERIFGAAMAGERPEPKEGQP